ncbi:hypothetical protein BRADI_3g40262v3, partial [Brachypodium distachyon]
SKKLPGRAKSFLTRIERRIETYSQKKEREETETLELASVPASDCSSAARPDSRRRRAAAPYLRPRVLDPSSCSAPAQKLHLPSILSRKRPYLRVSSGQSAGGEALVRRGPAPLFLRPVPGLRRTRIASPTSKPPPFCAPHGRPNLSLRLLVVGHPFWP